MKTPIALLSLAFCIAASPLAAQGQDALEITSPPDSFFEMVRSRRGGSDLREKAREFYAKYVEVDGMPIVASAEVADLALVRTHEVVQHMLAGRPDIIEAMVENEMYLIIIGKDQVYTDMPEYSNARNPDYLNERVRGTGGRPTSFGEENILSLPIDRYDDESIGVHEFCHTIDGALRSVDPEWQQRKRAVYQNAIDQGLYRYAYAAGNAGEYWAEIAQAYFDCNRVNNWNHNHVGTREQLKRYDPQGYELVRSTFRLAPEQDWRYRWLQPLPNVAPPPSKFNIDPFYTKFTYAREFPVVGRGASDEALLQANKTVRKLFAYRHDILKALINDGAKLVVLESNESLSDLPEVKAMDGGGDLLSRTLDYAPEHKLIVVEESNVMADPTAPMVGANQVIRGFATALFRVTADRPVDPNWEDRGRDVQQYELRVKRLDEEFGKRAGEAFEQAMGVGKWRGATAAHNRETYWAAGVLAYFDAAGQDAAPPDAAHPIRTRQLLQRYDEALFDLVHEVMAYEGHVDWRFTPSTQ